jgi:hypothetical protein
LPRFLATQTNRAAKAENSGKKPPKKQSPSLSMMSMSRLRHYRRPQTQPAAKPPMAPLVEYRNVIPRPFLTSRAGQTKRPAQPLETHLRLHFAIELKDWAAAQIAIAVLDVEPDRDLNRLSKFVHRFDFGIERFHLVHSDGVGGMAAAVAPKRSSTAHQVQPQERSQTLYAQYPEAGCGSVAEDHRFRSATTAPQS